MVRSNKIEASPHFREIIERLSKGESGRKVSEWLENTYNERITHATLNKYKKENIRIEERVEATLNKRAKKRKRESEKNKEVISQTSKEVMERADKVEAIEETVNTVADTIATNMEKLGIVGGQFLERFEAVCKEAEDPNSNVSSKDVARLCLEANKFYAEYFKQEGLIEINNNIDNIDPDLIGLVESIERSEKEFSDEEQAE